jgi:hypothetical protein
VIALLYSPSDMVFGQVKIHQRIEIEPKRIVQLQETPSPDAQGLMLLADSYVSGQITTNRMIYYFDVNGVSFGSRTPVDLISQLLRGDVWYPFGRFSAGTVFSLHMSAFSSCTIGGQDCDSIQEPRTYIDFTPKYGGGGDWFDGYMEFCFGYYDPATDYSGGAYLRVSTLLDHFKGSFSKDHIEIDEETRLNLQPVSSDGGSVGLADGVLIELRPPASIECLEADSVNSYWGFHYYYWGKAKNGIRMKGRPVNGDGDFRKDSLRINWFNLGYTCSNVDSLNYFPIWTRTYIDHYEIKVRPDTVDYSKTAKIFVQAKDENNNDVVPQLPANLLIQIVKPDTGGGGGAAGSVKQRYPTKMRAPTIQSTVDSMYPYGYFLDADSQKVEKIYLSYSFAHDSGVVYVAQGDSLKKQPLVDVTLTACDLSLPTRGVGFVSVKNPREILLGQTKYYYAKEENGELKIHETTDPDIEEGDNMVIMEDPVIANDAVNNDKIGVYWDYLKPDGTGLNDGVIRLIGRYWKEDTTYIVKLHALQPVDGLSETIEIEVKKPKKLGDTHNTANDVHGVSFNIDSLVIYYAGKEGVLPQYLKAMVSVETMGFFDPCYRYELFKDITELQVKNRAGIRHYISLAPYRILSSVDKGIPNIPTNHTNVRDASTNRINYPGYTTIWNYYWNHIPFYSLYIYPTGEPEEKWEYFYVAMSNKLFKKKNPNDLTISEKKVTTDSTDGLFFRWAKSEYQGGIENMIAQTRLSASYGLLQLVYCGGTEYPQNDSSYRPEDINDHSIGFQYGVKHLINNFNLKSILNGHFSDSTWQGGLEGKYKVAIRSYNGKGERAIQYANVVINRITQFLPKP